jgi:hypothetical protein
VVVGGSRRMGCVEGEDYGSMVNERERLKDT